MPETKEHYEGNISIRIKGEQSMIFTHICPQCGKEVNIEEMNASEETTFVETGLCRDCQKVIYG